MGGNRLCPTYKISVLCFESHRRVCVLPICPQTQIHFAFGWLPASILYFLWSISRTSSLLRLAQVTRRHTNYSEWGKCWLFCAVNYFSIVFLPHFPWHWVKRMRLASTLQKQMLQKCRKWKHWGVAIINGSVERSASITVLFAHIRGNAITSTLGWDRNSS